MKLSVFKNNTQLNEVDLSSEIIGLDDSEISFYIGRSEDCHIQLDDQKVSREHARISFRAGNWKINQLSGFGGLIINGVLTNEKELISGDVLTIGPYIINTFGLGNGAQIMSNSTEGLNEGIVGTESFTMNERLDTTETLMEDPSALAGNEQVADSFDIDGEELLEQSPDFTSDEFGLAEDKEEEVVASSESSNFTATELEEPNQDTDFNDDEAIIDNESSGIFSLSEEGEEGTDSGDEELFGEDSGDGFDDNDSEDVQEDGFDEGYDEAYEVDSIDDDKTQVITAFAKFELEIFGELAPFDKFVVDKAETIIGRDSEKCDIVLNDPEVSGQHAILKKSNITCIIEDLNSGNGTLLNGERINKASLTNNDEFIIGSTTFTVHVVSELSKQEEGRLMPVEENQIVEVEEIVEVSEEDADKTGVRQLTAENNGQFDMQTASSSESLFSKDALADPAKRKKLIYLVIGLIVVWILLEPEETIKKPAKQKGKEARLLSKDKKSKKNNSKLSRKFNKEEIEFLEGTYLLAKEFIDQGKYRGALTELDKIQLKLKQANVIDYKQTSTLKEVAKQGLAKLEEMERKQQAEIDRKQRVAKVKELVIRAKQAVKDRKSDASEAYFSQILELDPDNFDVPQLKIEIEAWKRKQDRIAIEKAQKIADRKRMVDKLAPGKAFYLKEEWYKAIFKLEDFLRLKQMDEDLVTDASKMLSESKKILNDIVNPLIGKARSLSEGQDLKGAYEVYGEILEADPTHDEALNEMNAIREKLTIRSRKIYREALISESLSLFNDAKEKFQEVQQIAPSDSDYYKKATAKLKDYLD
jgi:pSer/pThr/pTyr-binding forkhead associated (FHA) protein